MNATSVLLAESAALVVAVGFFQWCVLVLRDPERPPWLRGLLVEPAFYIGLSTLLSVLLALEMSGLMSLGLGPLGAMAPAFALAGVAWFAIWRLFGIGDRLTRANSGASPWGPRRPRQP